ncbi:MAG: M23 family metallopeptidase [Flavobacteriales bacterium]|nr:M23 family metallopeptidase [Flavobacteriales bacterium]
MSPRPARPRKASRRKKLIRKLRSTYRLVLIDDRTFAERFSIRLNRLNVLVLGTVAFLGYGLLITALIVFTPLKEHIPGYSDQDTRQQAIRSAIRTDSLERELAVRDQYLNNLRHVLSGELPVDSTTLLRPLEVKPGLADLAPGRADSALRNRVGREQAYNVVAGVPGGQREPAGVFFFPPIRGIVTSTFDRAAGHFGTDIVAAADAAVKACLDGTVMLASWTTDAGHVVQLQHGNDLVSVYKHNSVLLKKVGDRVKAGEVIAIVGNSGELTTGPHLHFELWDRGEAVDPQAFMVFE